MPVYNAAKSTNPNYWISLSVGNAGLPNNPLDNTEGDGSLSIITDLPEETSLSFSSAWEDRMPSNVADILGNVPVVGNTVQSAGKALGVNATFQAATQQVWKGTTPIEFPFSLLFDAYDSAKNNVFDPINALITYGLPSTKPTGTGPIGGLVSSAASLGGNILYAPGPNNIDRDKFSVKLRVGRMLFIPDGILVGCNPKFDSRIAADGYPIAGQVDIVIRTSVVYSRSDWLKATSQGKIASGKERGPR